MHLLKAATVLMQHCAATANSEVGSKRGRAAVTLEGLLSVWLHHCCSSNMGGDAAPPILWGRGQKPLPRRLQGQCATPTPTPNSDVDEWPSGCADGSIVHASWVNLCQPVLTSINLSQPPILPRSTVTTTKRKKQKKQLTQKTMDMLTVS